MSFDNTKSQHSMESEDQDATRDQSSQSAGPSAALPSFQATAKIKKKTKGSRQQIAVACLPCQRRKCRCDGTRPICNTCVRRGKTCEYNVDEGLSRVAHLKEKNKELEEDSKDLRLVIELLRKGSDSDAAAVLARLRVGQTVSSIVQASQGATPLSDLQDDPTPDTRPQIAEVEVAGDVPSQIQGSRILNRQDWGSSAQRRGAPSFPYHQLEVHGSQDQPTSRYPNYATHQRREASTPQAAAQAIVRQASPTMITHHEWEAQELVRLRNFGNMNFSSAILANGYPPDIQRQQVTNLFTPQWAKVTTSTYVPSDHPFKVMNDAMMTTLESCRKMLADGLTLDDVAGPHPRLAAIMDEAEFEKAPPLTQFACRMVYSIKETNTLFVCYASIYQFWWIMRWMIYPSPQTYFAIPECMRPSPTQLFMPHLLPFDFLAWPGLRDYLVHMPHKAEAEHSAWILDMSLNIGCACPLDKSEIIRPSPVDGELELSPKALEYASNIDSWSVTPSFRKYFLDADKWMRIRWD